MSTEIAPPTSVPQVTTSEVSTTAAPVAAEPASTMVESQVEAGSPEPEVPAVIVSDPVQPAKEDQKKRSPFGDLKNKLFHKSPSQPTSPASESTDPVKDIVADPKPAAEEEVAKENSKPEETSAVNEDQAAADPTESAPVAEEKPEKKEKVKTPLFEKVKSFFGDASHKKEKKVKTPTEEKVEPQATEAATPSAAVSEAPAAVAVPTVDITSPEGAALAEAKESANAPIPQIVDSGSPKAEVAPEQITADAESVKPVSAEESAVSSTPGAVESEESGKTDETPKSETKPPKKDLAKLGRRLSARLGAIFPSPKKEKTEAETIAPVGVVSEEASTPEISQPEVSPAVTTSEGSAVAPVVEEAALPATADEAGVKDEVPKAEAEVVAPVDAPGEELATEIKKTEEETAAPVSSTA